MYEFQRKKKVGAGPLFERLPPFTAQLVKLFYVFDDYIALVS